MKKLFILVIALVCVVFAVGCGSEPDEVQLVGVDAVVTGVDTENLILTVSDVEPSDVFGENRAIDCTGLSENKNLFKVDSETLTLVYIELSDFEVGDKVVVNVLASEVDSLPEGTITVMQIQLSE